MLFSAYNSSAFGSNSELCDMVIHKWLTPGRSTVTLSAGWVTTVVVVVDIVEVVDDVEVVVMGELTEADRFFLPSFIAAMAMNASCAVHCLLLPLESSSSTVPSSSLFRLPPDGPGRTVVVVVVVVVVRSRARPASSAARWQRNRFRHGRQKMDNEPTESKHGVLVPFSVICRRNSWSSRFEITVYVLYKVRIWRLVGYRRTGLPESVCNRPQSSKRIWQLNRPAASCTVNRTADFPPPNWQYLARWRRSEWSRSRRRTEEMSLE